ncbi:MAG TPA: thioredoxin domain-containing protein [Jiangellaceae bacterium]|nr:thioredoxin domain-containing protein [Jiangellaceae bacterium]
MGAQTGQTSKRTWVMPVAILTLAALLIALVVVLVRGQQEQEAAGESSPDDGPAAEVEVSEQPDLTSAERRDPDDLLAAGPVEAPVTLVVFSDYQCPYCAQWSDETLPLMMERVEAGDLRIEWRDVNIYGAPSERAARASYAAALQGSFWEYHDALFENGEKRSEAELDGEALVALAGELGLDTEQFTADMDAEPTQAQITENAKLGLDLGAHSTPAFVMGGQPMVGAQPSQVFVDAFEQALAAAE